ncbi:MAG: hypothetical protein JNN22_14885 [Rhodospirillales bacterium]|nr:hypothetical protein [Rhodospirillales bacterium]
MVQLDKGKQEEVVLEVQMRAALMGMLFVFVGSAALAQSVWVEGGSLTCADWATARQDKVAHNYESYAMGLLDGYVLATGNEFWRTKGGLARNQAFFYIDTFCQKMPLENVTVGIWQLFSERTGWKRNVRN